jgi:hypothetical protein
MLKGGSNPLVRLFSLVSFIQSKKMNIPWRPQLSPTLETDLKQVRIHRTWTIESDHALEETAAPAGVARAIEVASGIASGPHALRAMFSPRQDRSCDYFFAETTELLDSFSGELLEGFYSVVGFRFVHVYYLSEHPESEQVVQ